jgi:hypothetical protein
MNDDDSTRSPTTPHRNNAFRGTSRLDGRYRPGREGIIAMNSQVLGAALLAICVVGIAVGLSSIKAGDEYCPSPSAASVTALFAPCQTFDSAMGRSISKEEAVQMGLLTPDLQPKPATQLAHSLRSVPLRLQQPQAGTVGLAKSGPKGDKIIP